MGVDVSEPGHVSLIVEFEAERVQQLHVDVDADERLVVVVGHGEAPVHVRQLQPGELGGREGIRRFHLFDGGVERGLLRLGVGERGERRGEHFDDGFAALAHLEGFVGLRSAVCASAGEAVAVSEVRLARREVDGERDVGGEELGIGGDVGRRAEDHGVAGLGKIVSRETITREMGEDTQGTTVACWPSRRGS